MDSGGGFGWTGRKSSAIGNQMNVYIVIDPRSQFRSELFWDR